MRTVMPGRQEALLTLSRFAFSLIDGLASNRCFHCPAYCAPQQRATNA